MLSKVTLEDHQMEEKIIIAIISAGLATLVNCIFQFVNKLIDNHREDKKQAQENKNEYIEKKEKVYIASIDRLLQIKRGFDFTREMLSQNKKLQKTVEIQNLSHAEISAQLRLYSTDKIFNEYMRLLQFSRFSYAPESGSRLFEESKWAYDLQIKLLARQMQEDLGYRKYHEEPDLIMCPECGIMHDIVSTCSCGLTFSQLKEKANTALDQNDLNEASE